MFLGCFFVSCSATDSENEVVVNLDNSVKQTKKFTGNYNKIFDDLHDLHIGSAINNGITPLARKEEASKVGDKLKWIPKELPLYKMDSLTHSCPYLVPKASDLMIDICANFRDSLISKGITLYKPILTSLTRTNEDIRKLTKRNINASDNSAHCYGTTFDISWKRFEKVDILSENVSADKLKYILAEVLYDLKQKDRCYIKHERKQACFHITVR